jgi:hypothetical protein
MVRQSEKHELTPIIDVRVNEGYCVAGRDPRKGGYWVMYGSRDIALAMMLERDDDIDVVYVFNRRLDAHPQEEVKAELEALIEKLARS